MTKLRLADNLALPLDAVTQTFGVLAKRGVGKTYTAAVFVEELLKADRQVVVVDPIGVWFGLRSSADGKHAGLPIIVMGGDHGDVPLEVTAGSTIAEFITEQKRPSFSTSRVFAKANRPGS
jgi:DNA helicase HerA-like ATPase